jgi:hypothetical protein
MHLRIESNDMEHLASIGVLVVGNDLVQIPAMPARGRSLIVRDGAYASPTSTVPPPELCVSGNVLQGRMSVQPARQNYLPATVPGPMNTWEFLNTVITT